MVRTGKIKYVAISLPIGIVKEIDALMEELGYWPSRGAFVREACIKMIRENWARLGAVKPRRAREEALEGF